MSSYRQAILLKDHSNLKTPGQGHASSNPHLDKLLACDGLKWEFANPYSIQTVRTAPTFGKTGSDIYKKCHEVLLNYRNGELPERSAI